MNMTSRVSEIFKNLLYFFLTFFCISSFLSKGLQTIHDSISSCFSMGSVLKLKKNTPLNSIFSKLFIITKLWRHDENGLKLRLF